MNIRYSILIILISVIIGGCKKNGLNQPPEETKSINLLQNGSFEKDGVPSSSGWYFILPPNAPQFWIYKYSPDVPENGGKWSLSYDSLYEEPVLMLASSIDMPSIHHQYELTFWAKSWYANTRVQLMVVRKDNYSGWGRVVYIEDSMWTEHSIILNTNDSLYLTIPDSIRILQVILHPGLGPLGSRGASFDNFVLKQID
ncbi:MAG: hypothetical protein WCT99_07930 [Bacteroidota bacterium]|jgi:hypothetical protein